MNNHNYSETRQNQKNVFQHIQIKEKNVIIIVMDWYMIEYLYPKGFKRFIEIMFPHIGVPSLNILNSYETKKLYHFFDKESIYLIVEMLKSDIWVHTITTNDYVLGPGEFQKTREDCEINGFTDCFRILDKRLNV